MPYVDSAPVADQAVAEQLFDDAVRRYNEAFADRDVDRFLRFFREDATKIDSSGEAQWDKSQIADLFGELFKMDFEETVTPVKKVVDGDTALLVTDIKLVSKHFAEHFLTALTFTNRDGDWKVLAAASTNLPS
ncbi:conserved hypothetical protein [Amycolatopsis marina]|uniref:DUF4440 domain-containing protein n=1 Tax=Amycolatopsis marina TaxID=490629 RepID=A0A1I0ZNU6_9PSEU|nr:nuclear transport factor 2 family protein [Amycolatopsis marina]SFB25843.1 conserved hypothetical protein [Amycolatopsis marina]